jgi:hypothetical protein
LSLVIEILAPKYGLSTFLHSQKEIANWYFVSSIALPLYVVFELVWMFRKKAESRAILIDALFAGGWFCLWWIALVGTLYKTGVPWL